MACGAGLVMLLIFLVQAEHVCCSWATQAHSPQTRNRYVGFSQQDSRLRRLDGSYSQNQFRQASISPGQSSSLSTGTSYSQGLPTSSYKQTVSNPAQSSVRLVQSSLVSKPNWYTNLERVNAQEVPNHSSFGLSTVVASGSSVNTLSQNQNSLADISKKITWPVKRGTPHTSKYLSSSSASLQSPRDSYSFKPASQQSVAQTPANAAVWMQTSASALGKRVSQHKSEASKPLSISSAPTITRNVPIQTAAGKPYQNKWLPVNVGDTQGSYMPSYTSNMMVSYKPSYTFTEQRPSSRNPLQASWDTRNPAQGAHNLPAFGSHTVGTSMQRFAPTRVYDIPERFGGFAIRRLGDSKKEAVQKPHTTPHQRERVVQEPQTTSPPKQIVHLNKNAEHPKAKWVRIKLHQKY